MDLTEDSDLKLRRNFMLVSAAVVLVSWLQLPIGEIASSIFKFDRAALAQMSAWRAWIAVAVTLAYFAHRYNYSDLYGVHLDEYRQQQRNVRAARLKYSLGPSTTYGYQTWVEPAEFRQTFQYSMDENLAALREKWGDEFQISHKSSWVSASLTKATITFAVFAAQNSQAEIYVHMQRPHRWWFTIFRLWDDFRAAASSDSVTELFAPLMLGLAAAAIVGYNLGEELFWPLLSFALRKFCGFECG